MKTRIYDAIGEIEHGKDLYNQNKQKKQRIYN